MSAHLRCDQDGKVSLPSTDWAECSISIAPEAINCFKKNVEIYFRFDDQKAELHAHRYNHVGRRHRFEYGREERFTSQHNSLHLLYSSSEGGWPQV
jgi:hypothetical protein